MVFMRVVQSMDPNRGQSRMKVIIQCAATKDERGGYWQTGNGKRVKFIAYQNQEHSKDFIYARPDDVSDEGLPWRSLLWQYNETPHRNPFNLYPAYKLYSNEIYRDLANEFGTSPRTVRRWEAQVEAAGLDLPSEDGCDPLGAGGVGCGGGADDVVRLEAQGVALGDPDEIAAGLLGVGKLDASGVSALGLAEEALE